MPLLCVEFSDACDATEVPNSNYAQDCSLRALVDSSVDVICDAGYTGGGSAVCGSSGGSHITLPSCDGPCDGVWDPGTALYTLTIMCVLCVFFELSAA